MYSEKEGKSFKDSFLIHFLFIYLILFVCGGGIVVMDTELETDISKLLAKPHQINVLYMDTWRENT